MTTGEEKQTQAPGRFGATLVSLVLGQLVGDKATTIARMVLEARGSTYGPHDVAGGSLYVILVFACIGALWVALAARRRWATMEQVLTSTLVAVVVASLAIADYSLPPVPVDGRPVDLDFWELMYYVGWIVGLWYLPLLCLPRVGTFGVDVGRGARVLAVAATMTLLGLAAGFCLEQAATWMGHRGWFGDDVPWQRPQIFWIARPHTINAIYGSLVVVACVNVWWRDLWPAGARTYGWTLSVGVLAAAYAGLHGYFYPFGGMLAEKFVGFALLPLGGMGAVLSAYGLSRWAGGAAGWPVGPRYWVILCPALAVSMALGALVGLAPLEDADGERLLILVVLHSSNGLLMGGVLVLLPAVGRLLDVNGSHKEIVPRTGEG